MEKRRLIFVTNDDGYLSKGFRHIVELAREFGDVIAIAPERVQSGMSQAITINSPLFLRTVEESEGVQIYAFSGTPAKNVIVKNVKMKKNIAVAVITTKINNKTKPV